MRPLTDNTKLVILDRDGVVNYDSKAYVKSAMEWNPLPGSIKAISDLNKAGIIVCIATNQSGLGRGYFDISDFIACQEKLSSLLKPHGGKIDAVFFCPHSPDDDCGCRKPKSQMAKEALARFKVLPENAIFVGDSLRDLQSAEAAGIFPVLVKTGNGDKTLLKPETNNLETKPLLCFSDLSEFVASLLNK